MQTDSLPIHTHMHMSNTAAGEKGEQAKEGEEDEQVRACVFSLIPRF